MRRISLTMILALLLVLLTGCSHEKSDCEASGGYYGQTGGYYSPVVITVGKTTTIVQQYIPTYECLYFDKGN